ncbi:MAG: tRNA (adenosine(37)-N6)-dimethylallyltransferase MiaA [Candidatus Saccharibacteria bacterium]
MGNAPLVVIAGSTASGKTSLAVDLAKKFGGEIICADSRSIYKGMDIGTAKATAVEMQGVPHWGLDLVEPGDYFTVFDFKTYANAKIDDIRSRGKIPFLVGGTGLYIDAVIFDYQFGPGVDVDKRATLNDMSIEELHIYCSENDVDLPENSKNKRYVIRAIEKHGGQVSKREKPTENSIIVAISTDRDALRSRIAKRVEQMYENGVVDEASMLGKKYGWDNEALKSNAYRSIRIHLSDQTTIEQTKESNKVLDWRLAKRQLMWLRRNQYIKWLDIGQAKKYISYRLAKLA